MCQAAELELNLPQRQNPLSEGMEVQSTPDSTGNTASVDNSQCPPDNTWSSVWKRVRREARYGQDHTLELPGFHFSLVRVMAATCHRVFKLQEGV